MVDRPIIFSAPMVKALLAGWKTQTRRLLREPMPPAPSADSIHPSNAGRKLHAAPYFDAYCGEPKTPANPRGMSERWCWWTRDDRQCLPTIRIGYAPGDRLYVREAFGLALPGRVEYRAGHEEEAARGPRVDVKWQPSIHMLRAHSRLTLTVQEVRVQRLQDITEGDALAEGIEATICLPQGPGAPGPRQRFAALWDHLHGPSAWQMNPHVVALTFQVHQCNIDRMPA